MPDNSAAGTQTALAGVAFGGTHTNTDELVDYFEGALTDEQGESIELHLNGCAECSALAGNMFTSRGEYEQWLARHQKKASAG